MMNLAKTLVLLVATVPLLAKAWDFQKSLERLRGRTAAVFDGSGEAGTKSLQRARKDTEAFTPQDKTSYGLNEEVAFATLESYVYADKSTYELGESITITWNNQGTVTGEDWVALSYSSDGDETTVSEGDVFMWLYACGSDACSSPTASGTTTFVPKLGGVDENGKPLWRPPVGASFKALLLADNGYSIIAASNQISVVQSEPFDELRDDESCPGVCLDLYQGNNYIGEFKPISTDYSITTLYGYDSDNYSFNGDGVVPLVSDYSLLFIHKDSRTSRCDLSLVIVHDSKDTCSGGEVRMLITGDLEDSVVQDGRDSPSDTYTYDEATDETECHWEWNWQSDCDMRTDGIAHYWPSRKDCISVSAEFIRGIDEWQFVPGPVRNDGAVDPSDYIYLSKSRRLEICKREC